MVPISQRLLPVLQLTRIALVFTAIADSLCSVLLRYCVIDGTNGDSFPLPPSGIVVAMLVISFSLYGFGMSLNDIIDRRRDAQIAATRPLPSGRLSVVTAHVICVLLAVCALVAGGFLWRYSENYGMFSFILVIATGLLISFYDAAGKYLVGPGLVTLGMVRFFHSIIPFPQFGIPWHPLLLLNHVVILSTVAYSWEEKRPSLSRIHYWSVGTALLSIDALLIGLKIWLRNGQSIVDALQLQIGLLYPLGAVALFIMLGMRIKSRAASRRAAGQKLMLMGLLWLIIYDAIFVAVFVNWISAALIVILLPVSYFSVQLMRAWSQMVAISQSPTFQRAQTPNRQRPEDRR